MGVILIADSDPEVRKLLAQVLIEAGYKVSATGSAARALGDMLSHNAQVLILGTQLECLTAAELVPLLKKCNQDATIILVSDDQPLPQIRKVRREGIFYHLLRPANSEDGEELCLAVRCAMERKPQPPAETSEPTLNQVYARRLS
jgi:DNA-binding NtrC family response regulator